MARKARQRISYVLALANSPGAHRLGVNGLAVDRDQSILYSGGRDGVICAWDLNLKLSDEQKISQNPFLSPEEVHQDSDLRKAKSTSFRNQVQAHTHWVNDIILANSNTALVSASSDITVKVWRPHAEDSQLPQTIGLHTDYVKCLATPSAHSDWIASGGLDRKIRVWDMSGGGEKLEINVGEDENNAKGSVYALCVRGSIMASGGPESTVRLWDPKSGKRITKFVGHTGNVRDILMTQSGDMILTASSDQTVKVWSTTAGRCMSTLTMHSDSVWSLYSDHPQLSVFYSSDRSGLVAKTDVRDRLEMDQGLCVAVAQEHEGVNKLVAAGDYLWTATSSSSINRWEDIDTGLGMAPIDPPRHHRGSSITKLPSQPPRAPSHAMNGNMRKQVRPHNLLRLSNTTSFPSRMKDVELAPVTNGRKPSEAMTDADLGIIVPYHDLPEETIEGQHGLIKHLMLNDRRRVLTLDTAGEVVLWDLIKCTPIRSFGKRHLEDVAPEVNSIESVASWCSVDTRTGKLACILEENNCFDAEMYADEGEFDEPLDFREDQRFNLGKWVLRYLFANLVDEEIKRDVIYRGNLVANAQQRNDFHRAGPPTSIQLPNLQLSGWHQSPGDDDSTITPRALNGQSYPPMTPGIGVATPGPSTLANGTHMGNGKQNPADEGLNLEKPQTRGDRPDASGDRSGDYFSTKTVPPLPQAGISKPSSSPGDNQATETKSQSPPDPDKEEKAKESSSLFSKKFRMNFPKKLGRTSVDAKHPVLDEVSEDLSDKSSEKEDKVVENNFHGTVQKIRNDYEEHLQSQQSQFLPSGITPSLPSETPIIRLPPFTSIIIQEDRPDSGGVADLYRGTVGSAGQDADLIGKVAPMWLGELLLKNQVPFKETVKVSFILLPYQDLLPGIASEDGNNRLNANRMLRMKKIISYIAERIESPSEQPDPDVLKPEEYLELYCQNQLVPLSMTLATLRAQVWKTGGDVLLYYRSNGRRPSLERLMKMMDKTAETPVDE